MIYFKEQPVYRSEQVTLLKHKLGVKFDLINKRHQDYEHYDNVKSNFIANKFAHFIRSEDNSIRGFKVRNKVAFTKKDKPTKYAIHYRLFKNKMNKNIVECFYTKNKMNERIKDRQKFGYNVSTIKHSEESFNYHLR